MSKWQISNLYLCPYWRSYNSGTNELCSAKATHTNLSLSCFWFSLCITVVVIFPAQAMTNNLFKHACRRKEVMDFCISLILSLINKWFHGKGLALLCIVSSFFSIDGYNITLASPHTNRVYKRSDLICPTKYISVLPLTAQQVLHSPTNCLKYTSSLSFHLYRRQRASWTLYLHTVMYWQTVKLSTLIFNELIMLLDSAGWTLQRHGLEPGQVRLRSEFWSID